VRIELLGPLRVEAQGRIIDRFRTRKAAALLAYLAFYRDQLHSREALIEQLWPEERREVGRERLRTALSSLRRQLEPGRSSATSGCTPIDSILCATRDGVRLSSAITTDVAEFGAALRAASQAEQELDRVHHLSVATELYRGELLPGLYEEWAIQERLWLVELYFQALGQLLSHLQGQGELQRALEYAHRGVRADPLREELHRELIRLYAALGQHPAALRQYDELERLLRKELGAAPSAATSRLMDEVGRLAVMTRPALDVTLPSAPPRFASPRPHPVSGPEGENRLVTVLFADMSDSVQATTNLIPEEAAAMMSRLLTVMVDVVLKYEGRVDRFLGDGLLALFGVPQAHEDDPERAVRAALEIREAARHLGLEVTAGVNTGAVYVGPVGSEKHQETTAVGPVVNLASRLQGQAEAGQILVGEATYRQTRRAFEYSPLLLAVKGLTQPVKGYAVERAMPRPEKARGIEGRRAALIGRDEELARLQTALARPLAGEGQIVSLIGEAGIGKSRLVAEVKAVTSDERRVTSRDRLCSSLVTRHSSLLWLEGRCLELTMGTGYSLFVDLFRDYLAGDEDEPAHARRLVACLQELMAEGHLSPEQVEEIGPLLGNLLSLRFGTEWDQRLQHAGPEQIRHQTLRAVREFFVALARRQPLVLILEDLHWADSLSLELIALLVEALPLAPLLLLCIYRPEHQQRSHLGSIVDEKCAGRHTEIFLHELSPDQSRGLVEALLSGTPRHRLELTGSGLPPSVKALILEKARGNPFFIEELVRHLTEAGLADQEAGGVTDKAVPGAGVGRARGHVSSLPVPDTVQSVILSRVDRLRPELQQLLQLASIFGRLFRRRLLEKMAQSGEWPGRSGEGAGGPRSIPHPALRTALCELEDEALIYQERAVPEEEYSFQHVLTQETIYGTLLQRQRAALHQQAAEAIEAVYPESLDVYCEQLAYHYDRSEAEDKAVEYLVKAGEKAAWRAHLHETARDYFQRALDRLDSPQSKIPNLKSKMETRLAALTGLAGVYFALNRQSEAEARWREAIALGHEIGISPETLARFYAHLGGTLWFQRRRGDELLRVAQEGLRVVGEDTQSVGAALMLDACGIYPHRVEQLLRSLPYSGELEPPYTHTIERLLGENRLDEAEQWLERWEREARRGHDLYVEGQTHNIRRQLLIKRGDLDQALVENQKALEIFTRIGAETNRRIQLRCLPQTRSLIAYQERDVEALREITAALLPEQVGCLALNLGRLEELSASAGEFRAFCERLRRERPDLGSALAQWYLEPAAPRPCHRLIFEDLFTTGLAPDWEWLDPLGDAALSTGNGLEIEAPAGRGLWGPHVTAPRLLRWISGDFAVETVCTSASPEKPPAGGLLLWKDAGSFLRFDRGPRGTHEIGLERFAEGQQTIAGRGLPSAAVHLRLERRGQDVRALCSPDGRAWFRVAQVAFSMEDPVQVGLYAVWQSYFNSGPSASTVMRFKSFRVWELKSSNGEEAL
jgi:class 3 adenylate cyclase/DNA-binding SARP family transcriptional activator